MHSAWPAVTLPLPSFKVSLPHVLRIVPPCTPHGGTGCNFCFRERRDCGHITWRVCLHCTQPANLSASYPLRGSAVCTTSEERVSTARQTAAVQRRISAPLIAGLVDKPTPPVDSQSRLSTLQCGSFSLADCI